MNIAEKEKFAYLNKLFKFSKHISFEVFFNF